MSYRGFKRLLGESSLERKSRFLLGAVTLLLISASFLLYAKMNVGLAYDATKTAGRLLAPQVLYNYHVNDEQAKKALEDLQKTFEAQGPDALKYYRYRLYKPHSNSTEFKPDSHELKIIEDFKNDADLQEQELLETDSEKYYYYAAIRANEKCCRCHPLEKEKSEILALKPGQLYAVVRIELDSHRIEEGIHLSRAILISNALVTSILVMTGSYLIVRYVVVKPVKHLKEVSDSIANGYYNVRSEIQTGDEFEDLSVAFNRMIRNLLNKQEELNQAQSNLAGKVEELGQANLALLYSNQLKGDFLATVSHELRTPLHSILGFSDLLSRSDNMNEKQHKWAKNIRSSGAQLLDLINDVLELAKIEAGKMEVKCESFVAADLVERALEQFRPLAEQKKLELVTDITQDMPFVRQDAGKLRQILANLLSNAVKFTPDGGRVTVGARCDGDDLVLTVSDTGVGISPAECEVVFDKFRQAANPLTREHTGTGLGLSIVRELANLLGGDVQLQSELGKGSVFTVRVPRLLYSAAHPELSNGAANVHQSAS